MDEFSQATEIIPGLFFFVWIRRPDAARCSPIAQANIAFSIDEELLYEPFFADFGPLNLGKTYRFCARTSTLLSEAQRTGRKLFFYTGPHAHHKANAAVLVGIYQVLFLNRTADDAYKPLLNFKPYVPFRDASCGVSTFHLTVLDCLKGIQKARDVGFIDWNSGNSQWNIDEYEHYEQVENGDLNWIVPGKFVGFSGPAARCNEIAGYRLHTPEDYWDYFRRRGVTTIVRLNKKVYDRKRFLDGGFKHHEMYFPDGSCPSDAIIQRFLETVETEPGAIAVHCKAGLGRTGVLICSYMMKHYKFTAEEVIGYIRICRPGSVIGPQQNFIREIEARLHHEGDLYRASRGIKYSAGPAQELMVAGRATGADSSPPAVTASMAQPSLSRGGSANQRLSSQASGLTGGDLSLMAYSSSQPAAPYHHHAHALASSGSPAPAVAAYGSSSGGGVYGSSGASTPSSSSVRARYSQRSITPLRYGMPGGVSASTPSFGGGLLHTNAPLSAGGSAARSSATPGGSPVSRSMPSMPLQPTPVGGRAPSADHRAPSRGLSAASSLRATLHTETLQAADRPRSIPERNTQSADITNSANHGAWKIAASPSSYGSPSPQAMGRSPSAGRSGGMSTARQTPPSSGGGGGILAAAPGTANGSVARVLAPNGQPRKVPVALLSQYQQPSIAAGGPVKSNAQLRYGFAK